KVPLEKTVSAVKLPKPNQKRLLWALQPSLADTWLPPAIPFSTMVLPNWSLLGPGPSGRGPAPRGEGWVAGVGGGGGAVEQPAATWTPLPTLPGTKLSALTAEGLLPSTTSAAGPSSGYQLTGRLVRSGSVTGRVRVSMSPLATTWLPTTGNTGGWLPSSMTL